VLLNQCRYTCSFTPITGIDAIYNATIKDSVDLGLSSNRICSALVLNWWFIVGHLAFWGLIQVFLGFYCVGAVELMKPGATVNLRNAKIDMFKGSMRLAVDKWGRIEATEPADITVKEDNNLSLVEYELVNVVEEWCLTPHVSNRWYIKCHNEFCFAVNTVAGKIYLSYDVASLLYLSTSWFVLISGLVFGMYSFSCGCFCNLSTFVWSLKRRLMKKLVNLCPKCLCKLVKSDTQFWLWNTLKNKEARLG